MQLTIAATTVCIVLLAGSVLSQMPIPTRPNGYGVGGPADAQVVVEMFICLLCPDSKAAWPVALQVMQTYGTRIHFRIHIFPLPYHTNACVAAQGLQVIANFTNRDTDAIFRYTTLVFDKQDMWSNGPTQNMTMLQVMDSLASFVAEAGFMAKNEFLDGLKNSYINQETRIAWKYACSRGERIQNDSEKM